MRRKAIIGALIVSAIVIYPVARGFIKKIQERTGQNQNRPVLTSIHDRISRGETVFDIFKRHGLNMNNLSAMRKAAFEVHRLRDVRSGQQYSIVVDDHGHVDSFVYWIDDDFRLKIERDDGEYRATKYRNPYESRIRTITGTVKDNLISAIGSNQEEVLLALKISDIFGWDIDFTSDLRPGDTFKIVVQGLYFDNSLRKYGEVLFAEFVNNGKRYLAYKFLCNGKIEYYDEQGNSLRKAFLKAPLSFRRISSVFSNRRLHPVFKKYRPHRGVDYAAARGTPVSVTSDGTVSFAGRKGPYGNMVVVLHQNGYSTYYGHLSRIKKGIHRNIHVHQGDVIGYVGATGLATGPHLHYEMKRTGKHVNPLTVKLSGDHIPAEQIPQFVEAKAEIDKILGIHMEGGKPPATAEKASRYSDREG